MAHCIQAIVAKFHVTQLFCNRHTGTCTLKLPQDFGIIPVDREMVEKWTGSQIPQSTETFIQLTDEFINFLKQESSLGCLAYLETEYFGDEGGEGAFVVDNGRTLMEAAWETDSILTALRLLGVKPLNDRLMFRFANEVAVLGIDEFRSNDAILKAINSVAE